MIKLNNLTKNETKIISRGFNPNKSHQIIIECNIMEVIKAINRIKPGKTCSYDGSLSFFAQSRPMAKTAQNRPKPPKPAQNCPMSA